MITFLHHYRDLPFLCPLFYLFIESQISLICVIFLNTWTEVPTIIDLSKYGLPFPPAVRIQEANLLYLQIFTGNFVVCGLCLSNNKIYQQKWSDALN